MNNLNHVDSLRIDPQSNQSDDVRLSMALRRIRFAYWVKVERVVGSSRLETSRRREECRVIRRSNKTVAAVTPNVFPSWRTKKYVVEMSLTSAIGALAETTFPAARITGPMQKPCRKMAGAKMMVGVVGVQI